MVELSERFAAAAGRLPLSALPEPAGRELAAVLVTARALEDLPGKWQAALLQAEAAQPHASGSCCCGGGAATRS